MKACIVGSRKAIPAFLPLGFEVLGAEKAEEARRALEEAVRRGYGLLLVTEDLAVNLRDEIESLSTRMLPVVGVIPGPGGSMGTAMTMLKARVEKALGADILFRGEETSR